MVPSSLAKSIRVRVSRVVSPIENLFVTVGSTDFDPLVREVDRLAPSVAHIGVAQIGEGHYEPRNLSWFRFAPSLADHYKKATIVVAQGGLATTMEVLRLGIPLVSVANPDRYDDHQTDLLARLERSGYLVWCRRPRDLEAALDRVRVEELRPYVAPACDIARVIGEILR